MSSTSVEEPMVTEENPLVDEFDAVKEEEPKLEPKDPQLIKNDVALKKIEAAKEKVDQDPFDQETWMLIIFEVQSKPIEIVRSYWEQFFQIYPTAGKYWKIYVEQELQQKNFENVENIFRRCLKQCPHVDLWRVYLKYVTDCKGSIPELKQEVIHAFELAVRTVGMDLLSTPIWSDYIRFVKNYKTSTPIEDSVKMEQLRKLYQRAVVNPMQNLESIWKEYDAFENGLNKLLAKNLLAEHAPKYMQARTTYRERKNYLDGLQRNMLARPPRYAVGKKDAQQISLWKKLLVYEKQNPQKLSSEGLRERISFTYNQCLMCLYHFPEIWHEAAIFQLSSNRVDDAIMVYRQGVNAVRESVLLSFSFADFLESQGRMDEAKGVYEKILSVNEPLVYIQYMRFARRSTSVREAREIFYRARKSQSCTYQVYVAAAEMELHANENDEIARHIYELGFKKYKNSMGFLLEYIQFLFRLNDRVNVRSLFEKILAEISPDKAPEIWNSYQKFERLCGNLNSLTDLERRRAELYPDQDPNGIFSLVQRYRFLDLWPCSPEELASFEGGHRAYKVALAGRIARGEDTPQDAKVAAGIRLTTKEKFAKPDLSKLVLFNPESISHTLTLVNGETITLPATLSQFLNALPKPNRWDGPVVNVDGLIQSLSECQPKLPAKEEGRSKKRPLDHEDGPRPNSDIYRERQNVKLQKQAETNKIRRI